jgi:chromosomal replication initiator protein
LLDEPTEGIQPSIIKANHYAMRIEKALRAEGFAFSTLSIILDGTKPGAGSAPSRDTLTPPIAIVRSDANGENPVRRSLWDRMLHPAQSFESFVAGPQSEFAFRAAQAFAESDGGDVSLLFVHGGFGYGKTHLANATALEAKKRNKRVLFLGAEDFMRHFLGALHRKETLAFKDDLRAADMLIIDDLQHICGRATMSEFLHTVNALIEHRRKVMIAADKPPMRLEGLSEDVRSRLAGGLVIGLEKPDRGTRFEILKLRAAEFSRHRPDAALPDAVLDRIAAIDDISPREMIGMFVKLATYADLTKKPVTMEMVEEGLSQRGQPQRKLTIEDIQKKAAEYYKLDVRDFHSAGRARRIARPRQVAMYLARQLTMRSLPEIGRRFGGRDHTTVLHACRRIEALCGDDPLFKQEIDFLLQVLSRVQ